jgi:hypothetical protein
MMMSSEDAMCLSYYNIMPLVENTASSSGRIGYLLVVAVQYILVF